MTKLLYVCAIAALAVSMNANAQLKSDDVGPPSPSPTRYSIVSKDLIDPQVREEMKTGNYNDGKKRGLEARDKIAKASFCNEARFDWNRLFQGISMRLNADGSSGYAQGYIDGVLSGDGIQIPTCNIDPAEHGPSRQ